MEPFPRSLLEATTLARAHRKHFTSPGPVGLSLCDSRLVVSSTYGSDSGDDCDDDGDESSSDPSVTDEDDDEKADRSWDLRTKEQR